MSKRYDRKLCRGRFGLVTTTRRPTAEQLARIVRKAKVSRAAGIAPTMPKRSKKRKPVPRQLTRAERKEAQRKADEAYRAARALRAARAALAAPAEPAVKMEAPRFHSTGRPYIMVDGVVKFLK